MLKNSFLEIALVLFKTCFFKRVLFYCSLFIIPPTRLCTSEYKFYNMENVYTVF